MTNSDYIKVVYSEEKNPFTVYPSKLISELAKRYSLKSNTSILELGCGRGEFLNEFTKIGMKTYGIDISDYAKKNCPSSEIKVVDVVKEKIPYPDNYFDVIYSKSFIEHFYYPEEIFKEAYRVLKPSGKFINLTPEWSYIYLSFYEDFSHRTPFTKKSLKDIHEVTGFKNVNVGSFKQLPILWSKNLIINYFYNTCSELTRLLVPNIFRLKSKWIRFSKEIMLISSANK